MQDYMIGVDRKMLIVYVLIGGTILFTVAGQLLIKAAMIEIGAVPTVVDRVPYFLIAIFTNWKAVLGLAAAVTAAILWMGAVSRSDISFAYPFMALAIVLVLVLAGQLFGEQVPLGRWIGVVIVCIGLIVAARF